MVLIVAVTICIWAILSFFLIKTKLTFGEIIAYCMVFSIFRQDYIAILSLNLHKISITEDLGLYWTQVVIRTFFYPLLLTWYMNLIYINKSFLTRAFLTLLFACILTASEVLTEKYGIITYLDWNMYFAFIAWLVLIILGLIFMKFLKRIQLKG